MDDDSKPNDYFRHSRDLLDHFFNYPNRSVVGHFTRSLVRWEQSAWQLMLGQTTTRIENLLVADVRATQR